MKILVGVTGSIAAYKTPELLRILVQSGAAVKTVLTASGARFITPITLQAASSSTVHTTLLDYEAEAGMSHIELARWADLILVAPASANFIAKLAHGFCDDLLRTLCLATHAKIILAPAMNKHMWLNSATKDNVAILRQRGIKFIYPDEGLQACGDIGFGRMVEPECIAEQILQFNRPNQLLYGVNILITAGSTQEPIDPVRFIGNRSSGKMGFALASAAIGLGAHVTLICGHTDIAPPDNCSKIIRMTTALDMLNAVEQEITNQDIFIGCAAVSDYHVKNVNTQKIKRDLKSPITLILEPNTDIIATVAQKYAVFTVGFAAETENLVENATNKLTNKALNMIIANNVVDKNIGFESDYNEVCVISKAKNIQLSRTTKTEIAEQIMTLIHDEWARYKHDNVY